MVDITVDTLRIRFEMMARLGCFGDDQVENRMRLCKVVQMSDKQADVYFNTWDAVRASFVTKEQTDGNT